MSTPALRDAIAKVCDDWCVDPDTTYHAPADRILALPLMAAHLRVVDAGRAVEETQPNSRLRTLALAELHAAVAELDALENNDG
jgi:hypothetical protein